MPLLSYSFKLYTIKYVYMKKQYIIHFIHFQLPLTAHSAYFSDVCQHNISNFSLSYVHSFIISINTEYHSVSVQNDFPFCVNIKGVYPIFLLIFVLISMSQPLLIIFGYIIQAVLLLIVHLYF